MTKVYVNCFLLALIAFSVTSVFADSIERSQIPSNIQDVVTCFDGHFSTLDSYRKHLKSKKISGKKLNKALDRYRRLVSRVECNWFYYEVDGLTVQGFYAKPKSPTSGKLPVVIFNRGGNADTPSTTQYLMGRVFPIVEAGFLVIGSQYRGAKINGVDNPDRLKDEFGGQDVNDVMALLPIIDAIPEADANKIALWGISRGGMMSFQAAARSNRFTTLISFSSLIDGVDEHQRTLRMKKVHETWIPDFKTKPIERLKERSVIYWTEKLDKGMPILLLHGTSDWRVHPENTLKLAIKLQQAFHPYQLVMYEDGGHGLRNHEKEVNSQIIDWLKAQLNKK